MLCNPWAEDLEGCGTPPEAEAEVIEEALAVASEILYALSGRQFPGLCDVIFRPCGDFCRCEYDACGCNRLPRVWLGHDVVSVGSVDIDGTILDPSAYRLSEGWLLRLDGGSWPCCQDMAADPGAEDTFSITGLAGVAPSATAVRAAKALAVELVRACTPGEEEACALPERVTNIVRQGASMTILDPFDFLTDGRSGIYIVDLFISSSNPNGLSRPSRAWSPDLPVTLREIVPSS